MMNTVDQKELIDKFVDHLRILKGLQDSSVRAYRRHVEEFLSWRKGNALDGPTTRSDVENYLTWCFYRGNSNQTRITKTGALRNFFRYLLYAGIQTEDPTATLPRPRATRSFMGTFSKDEILRMFVACDINQEKGIRDAVFLILGAFCGFRVSEISGFNIEQVQDDGKNLDLLIPRTKRGAGRSVYLWKAPGMFVRQLLAIRIGAKARTGDPLLVTYYKGGRPRGSRLSTRSLESLLKKIARRANVRKPAIRIHLLRSTHANDLQLIRGYGLPQIMERMGWRNLSTAERYLVRRERVHRDYRSLHELWIDFTHIWTKEDLSAQSPSPLERTSSL